MEKIVMSSINRRKPASIALVVIALILCSVARGSDAQSPGAYDKYILTPAPGPRPRINGPNVFGSRPGNPFIYRIPCTGRRPMTFAAVKLPPSLRLDPKTGIITGTTPTEAGTFAITLKAKNELGESSREFRLVAGDKLALTPPMGWNDWYIHYDRVTDAHMRQAADVMISSGLADAGYMYVNIDDCWMKKRGDLPLRDANKIILTNEKFPDMKALTDYIHSKGLRAGLYTSPGEWTCGGYTGAYKREKLDAETFAGWGFDFLKYDWCSYSGSEEFIISGNRKDQRKRYMRPYTRMGDILKSLRRDIVFNLCQYGMENVWEWGAAAGGNSWRTTGDLGLEQGSHLPGFYSIGMSNAKHYEYARPGEWNDPDYILIGWVGNAHGMGEGKPTDLTPDEQYSYMSMWSLMASPLIFSGDMAKLDAFTLNVLTNAEVIEVDQDPLGMQARIVRQTPDVFILAKPLEDGAVAVGLFNLTDKKMKISATWSDLGITRESVVRDLWRQKHIGNFNGEFSADVAPHGVSMVRITPARM